MKSCCTGAVSAEGDRSRCAHNSAAEPRRSPSEANAALDVQEVEPPPESSPLYSLDNVILTPHIGWKRVETRQRLMDIVADNVAKFLDGSPINVVGA